MLQWPAIEPVLRRTYELMESSGRTTGQAVMADLGIGDNDAASAFDALASADTSQSKEKTHVASRS
jgi:hypothetical protein